MRLKARAVAMIVVASTLALAADPPASPDARARFRAGVALMSDPDGARVEEAYRLFKEAYAIDPSWKILGNLGAAAMRLERHGEALDALARYLEQGGADVEPAERAQIERDLQTLRAASAALSIRAIGGQAQLVIEDVRARADGGRVLNSYTLPRDRDARLIVALGRHRLTATIDGRAASWEGEVGTSGAEVSLTAPVSAATASSAPSPPAPRRHEPTARILGVGALAVGGAMLTAGVVTAIVGQRKKLALDDACPDHTCPESRRGDVDALRGWATATNVLVFGGALFAAGGVTAIALDRDRATTLTWSPTSVALRREF